MLLLDSTRRIRRTQIPAIMKYYQEQLEAIYELLNDTTFFDFFAYSF
jgi:hypothetical protein